MIHKFLSAVMFAVILVGAFAIGLGKSILNDPIGWIFSEYSIPMAVFIIAICGLLVGVDRKKGIKR